MWALFAASLANPTPPSVVADLIRDIVDADSWQLRYPAGPGAAPVLKRRASKTDEQVIEEAAQSDEEFLARSNGNTGSTSRCDARRTRPDLSSAIRRAAVILKIDGPLFGRRP